MLHKSNIILSWQETKPQYNMRRSNHIVLLLYWFNSVIMTVAI